MLLYTSHLIMTKLSLRGQDNTPVRRQGHRVSVIHAQDDMNRLIESQQKALLNYASVKLTKFCCGVTSTTLPLSSTGVNVTFGETRGISPSRRMDGSR